MRGIAVYVDAAAQVPYCLHFFEITVRGQNTKGDSLNLYGEVVAVRDDFSGDTADRFAPLMPPSPGSKRCRRIAP